MTSGGGGETLERDAASVTTRSPQRLVLLVFMSSGVREFDLTTGSTCTIGRSPASKICLDNPSVSRDHATIVAAPDGIRVSDPGSRNGTFVNEARVGRNGAVLQPGDRLRFGDVDAQLQTFKELLPGGARLVLTTEFDHRLDEETERGVRFRRPFALICVEISSVPGSTLDLARRHLTQTLRLLDVITLRGVGRLDALLPECAKDEAYQVAERIHAVLASNGAQGRLGVASFPDDGASPQSLLLAAQGAMRASETGVRAAASAVRTLTAGGHEIVVADAAMVNIFALVDRIAPGSVPVLIEGETGVGKEMVSRLLHERSPRGRKPFLAINCAALPEALFESELFGHERGAFTGAVQAKPGLLESACGGTVLLDEIGEMPAGIQAKLLRVLDTRQVFRIGSVKARTLDVRFLAATNRDLQQEVQDQRFRSDLFFRLNGFTLAIPPLRMRLDELPALAQLFAAEMAQRLGRDIAPLIRRDALDALLRHDWPGNIRELRNAVERAVVLADDGEVTAAEVRLDVSLSRPELPLERTAASGDPGGDAERARIQEALRQAAGNQSRAAARLGISRKTLIKRIVKLDLPRPRKGQPEG
jgi:two-component system response regulator AtoC